MHLRTRCAIFVLVGGALVPAIGHADMVDGSFESGDYVGWTLTKDASAPSYATAGTLTTGEVVSYAGWLHDFRDGIDVQQYSSGLPVTGAPTEGQRVAVFLQNGPATQRMYQTVTVPDAPATLSWDLGYRNTWTTFADDQRLRVVLRDPDTDAILETLFETRPGDELTLPMTHQTADVSAYAGATVRLDVVLDVREHFLDAELDGFHLDGAAAVAPEEPAAGGCSAGGGGTGALAAIFAVALGRRRRRARVTAPSRSPSR